MYRVKLGMNTSVAFGIPVEEQITLLKQTGFEAFFTAWDRNLVSYRECAEKTGMIYQSVHGPFHHIGHMWEESEIADNMVGELLQCVRDCAAVGVPIMVCHVYMGFSESAGPNRVGLDHFRRVVDLAGEMGVKIAFENTEGDAYLAALMREFKTESHVGFCWDSGHEMCYNDRDMLELYGDRLIATHLNDNLGIRNYDGTITFLDDLHLLPFDGIGDWRNIAQRLNRCGYDDILTFELKTQDQAGRYHSEKYRMLSLEAYFAEAYARACRVGAWKRTER